jgi:CDP-glucose 4,6-dehydratase
MIFGDFYRGKRVLVTGNTGFKGSWLSIWLLEMGAEVFGYALDIPSHPSLFEEAGLEQKIKHKFGDIRDLSQFQECFSEAKPDLVFHLAAQSIVSRSYQDPVTTVSTNVLGTTHVLEVLRSSKNPCTGILITSDKCYENVEWVWGYRESDRLGGKDLYSASKGAAELIAHAYHCSFSHPSQSRIATARAGNVIGGGDWACDRIVPDAMRAWSAGKPVEIRRPQATRPWQHVLEPLSGYLRLGQILTHQDRINGESYNFGPRADQNASVGTLLKDLKDYWTFKEGVEPISEGQEPGFHEAGLLKLNCDQALNHLQWMPTLTYPELIRLVSTWYLDYYKSAGSAFELTSAQIQDYVALAQKREQAWIQPSSPAS